jgi:hypothetical protein
MRRDQCLLILSIIDNYRVIVYRHKILMKMKTQIDFRYSLNRFLLMKIKFKVDNKLTMIDIMFIVNILIINSQQ